MDGSQDAGSLDPQLERQVETIRSLVDSYMHIIVKTVKDIIPKTVMHLLMNETKDYIHGELMAQLYSSGSPAQLMEENPEETRKREENLKIYNACQTALKIIGEVTMNTSSSGVPPPVDDGWRRGLEAVTAP